MTADICVVCVAYPLLDLLKLSPQKSVKNIFTNQQLNRSKSIVNMFVKFNFICRNTKHTFYADICRIRHKFTSMTFIQLKEQIKFNCIQTISLSRRRLVCSQFNEHAHYSRKLF